MVDRQGNHRGISLSWIYWDEYISLSVFFLFLGGEEEEERIKFIFERSELGGFGGLPP